MRFGNWRGVTLAVGFASAVALMLALSTSPALAQDFHTIPRLVPAVDLNTGGPYYAPPIPYGHYAGKNIGGKLHGLLGGHGLGGHGSGCGLCGGKGCDSCAGKGGHGLFHGGNDGCGSGGLFGKHKGFGSGCGLCGGKGCGSCIGHSSTVECSAQALPAAQAPVVATPQCGDLGCGPLGKHKKGCGLFGKGCGIGDPCGGCGGKGCGLCKGPGGLCKGCGGAGCGLCARARGLVGHLLGHDRIEWFTGPGGPVPLTPGYTPYVNVTRSPRDFLAFPPYTP
jgi:hypothetical protein